MPNFHGYSQQGHWTSARILNRNCTMHSRVWTLKRTTGNQQYHVALTKLITRLLLWIKVFSTCWEERYGLCPYASKATVSSESNFNYPSTKMSSIAFLHAFAELKVNSSKTGYEFNMRFYVMPELQWDVVTHQKPTVFKLWGAACFAKIDSLLSDLYSINLIVNHVVNMQSLWNFMLVKKLEQNFDF